MFLPYNSLWHEIYKYGMLYWNKAEKKVSIGLCVFIGIISFIVGSFSGICMICMCVVGGSGDESGADSNIEEEHKPEA